MKGVKGVKKNKKLNVSIRLAYW